MKKYLFIGSHVDDVELSCAGTISKLLESGHQVTVLCMSRRYEGIDLINEWSLSLSQLGATFFFCRDFTTRHFNSQSNEILQILYEFKDYDYVFTHHPDDIHSDHSVVGKASLRVFKNTNLITYQGAWNTRKIDNNYFVRLEKNHLQNKVECLKHYNSQSHRAYIHPDFIWANALNSGVMCGTKYAESFQSINIIQ